jgi:hypothetical protein
VSKNKKTEFILELIENGDESLIDKVVEVLKQISKKNRRWKPKEGENYFYINECSVVDENGLKFLFKRGCAIFENRKRNKRS